MFVRTASYGSELINAVPVCGDLCINLTLFESMTELQPKDGLVEEIIFFLLKETTLETKLYPVKFQVRLDTQW